MVASPSAQAYDILRGRKGTVRAKISIPIAADQSFTASADFLSILIITNVLKAFLTVKTQSMLRQHNVINYLCVLCVSAVIFSPTPDA